MNSQKNMESKFKEAYQKILSKILGQPDLIRKVEIIALVGSVANEEESDGWSDLDILIVLKSDNMGNIPKICLDKLQQITTEVSQLYSFPISVLSHTIDDLEKYVSFEYLKHYSFGKCSYPNPTRLKEIVNSILEKRKIDNKTRQAYCVYHLRHIRFNILRKYVSLNKLSHDDRFKEFSKLLIDEVIKVTDLALNFIDLWPRTKRQILREAETNLNIEVCPLVKALEIRNNWKDISINELEQFLPTGIEYILKVTTLILNKYNEPTPEEKMTT